ncbi:DUF4349 domain-containing protein [Streptomyces sp. AC555_RSS877]|uniref:DUF4349 domain-containing protein n=1 Tax=Streptomyces sp. AC555_RSS877 TaxID=2823688 RepID=UPI001C25453C|nr:DUF4349 domain-containing protein [Streptomyces sp. AC555_RSS877]
MRTRRSVRPARTLAGVLLAAGLVLTGCSAGAGSSDSDGGTALSEEKADAPGAAADSARGDSDAGGAKATAPPKISANHIIRTASLTVQVKNVSKSLAEARTTIENAGGYVGNETTTRDEDGHEQTHVVLRVPVEEYEEVLAGLEGSGKLLERTAKAQDVTDQVVDVESRITSQRASVARIRELMDQATRLSDVVTLEGELSTRQADLESLLARQASLKDRAGLATITLNLSETPVKETPKEDEDPGVLDALTGGWDTLVTMLRWIVVAIAAVLPFAAVIVLILLVWLRLVRPRMPRRPATASATTALGPLPTARTAPEPTGPREGGEEN